jgi:hypothetical protein
VKKLLYAAPLLIVLPFAAACGPNNSTPGATSSSAQQTATVADALLTQDGYRPLHVPGFGKADVGIKVMGNGYELVYTAKDAELVKTAVDEANKHPEQGVSFRAAGSSAVVQATSLKQLQSGLKTLATSLH